MRRELRGRDGPAFRTLAFEHSAHLAMELCARGRTRPIVEHLLEKRVAEGIALFVQVVLIPGTWRREPELLPQEPLTLLRRP